MKLCRGLRLRRRNMVAPHAGAWIETWRARGANTGHGVAPHAGAWIETPASRACSAPRPGRPPRGGVD